MSERIANNERMNTIYYFRRQNYGNIHFYFAKRAHRNAFRLLTGKKTFDLAQSSSLRAFGNFEFKEILESAPEVEPINSRSEG